jgi:hypothetical protein
MLQQATYTLSASTATQVVAPTVDAGHYLLKNIQPEPEIGAYSAQGYTYAVSRYLTIANNGTAIFSFTTGASGAQFDFWTFTALNSSVLGELIEGATITTTGDPILGYNLNRNDSDAHTSVLRGATALTGGTVVLSELIAASNQSGGQDSSDKVVTLKPNTQYGFRFTDVGGNGPNLHIQLGWVEIYNGQHDIWLGTLNNSFVLRGGEEIQFKLFPGEAVDAIAGHTGARLSVVRQD